MIWTREQMDKAQQAVEDYRRGMTIQQVAAKLDMKYNTMRDLLRTLGVVFRVAGRKPKPPPVRKRCKRCSILLGKEDPGVPNGDGTYCGYCCEERGG